uniref:NADH-ubiquinone oxidoreductase chain 1 n=1 Tax=Vasdavidius concursus TaxID=290153 RepID=Q68PI9_9HEMI|nr:NADH dehydrogenase subunit 1 [Vasdavidius concursus]
MIKMILNLLFFSIMILMEIAFFTLLERKMISFSQNRTGPMKVSFLGIIQPISDAMKLISKETKLNLKSNSMLFILCPMINLITSILIWTIMPSEYMFNFMKMSLLFMLAAMATNTVSIMIMSWSSNSNYAMISMIRTIAQMISYEINIILIVLTFMVIMEKMNLSSCYNNIMLSMYMPYMLIMWLITIMAETSRSPFDFSESESELISGFNIEYSSKSFVFLFLAEYSMILNLSMVTTNMMLMNTMNISLKTIMFLMISSTFIWIRTTLPRFRYDKQMKLNWTQLLPMTMSMMNFVFLYKIYCTKKS